MEKRNDGRMPYRQPDLSPAREDGGAECGICSDMPALAMVYAPIQKWRGLYDAESALTRGTLFSELDKPLEDRYE